MSRSRVKNRLTPDGRRTPVENTDYAAFVRRAIRAHGRRVGTGDVEGLTDLLDLAAEVEAATRRAVLDLREFGYSWAEIGSRLKISRQAAQQRWGGER